MFLVVEGIREKRYRICVLGNPQLYESWEVQSHQRYFSDLLINIGGASEKPLHEISIVSNCCPSITQYHRLTREHMEAQVPECFHYLIQLQSVKTPAAVAILENHREISYLTLNQQSNRFANFLKDRGVGRGDIVGLCVDRSVDMLVSLLGILKVGAAYLPLDAELPPTRLAFMVADAKAKLIVTQTAYELQMPDHLASLVFVDAPDHGWEEWPTTAPLSAVSGSDLAYVIYTSGSTGEPKGVLVEHRSVCNLLGAQREFVSPGLGARVLQFASLSFDVSVSEIGMALAGGATLVMADKRALSLENLTATLREKKIEVLSLSPSALSAISCENLPWLRTLIVAGEACPVSLAQLWSPARRFINAYGPTEATVYATYHEYRGGSSLPIGRPLANVDVYILDEHQKLAAIGVGGELHIGGVGVARGYLNRPELSSRQFVTNPFSEGAGQMYRTGDLARWLPDGSIEFLGRKDQQVKIRGFRIELGEVEVALAALADVRECTVVDYQVGSRKQLVAYLVPRTLARRSSRELRRDLRQQLPDYMIPSIIAYLEALPRTLSGKIDRRALPTPNEMFLKRAYVRPVTDTQIAMATIWSQALDLDRVGRTDNFLDSGGDSIAVINVLAAAEKTFGVSLPVHALYEAETLEDLAAEIDRLLTA
jgi:amino acid adenylation domain-containing protein